MRTVAVIIVVVVVLTLGVVIVLGAGSLHVHIVHYVTHHLLGPRAAVDMTRSAVKSGRI